MSTYSQPVPSAVDRGARPAHSAEGRAQPQTAPKAAASFAPPGQPFGPAAILALQRSAGNRAVQRLLQRRGAAGRGMLQRKMGLEFETGVEVRHADGGILDYDEPIAEAKNWVIKADSSNMEFVTEPLVDEKAVDTVMGDMVEAVGKIDGVINGATKDERVRLSQLGKAIQVNADRENWTVKSPDHKKPIAAKPQVTFGVPLESMMQLMEDAAAKRVDAYVRPVPVKRDASGKITSGGDLTTVMLSTEPRKDDLKASYEYGKAFYDEAMKGAPTGGAEQMTYEQGVRQIAGLVTLVTRYLNDFWMSQYRQGAAAYAKGELSVLSRSDFHSMYLSLEKKLRAKYFTLEGLYKAWGNVDEKLLKKSPTHAKGFEEEHKSPSEDPKGLLPFWSGGVHSGYSLFQWLKSIIDTSIDEQPLRQDVLHYDELHKTLLKSKHQGKKSGFKDLDLMSRGAVAYNSLSMGAMGMDETDFHYKAKLAVVEFRQLANAPNLSYEHWVGFAKEMFEFYLLATIHSRTERETKQQLVGAAQ